MPPPSTAPAIEKIDSSYLESLVGYNARRASLAIVESFLERMAVHELKPVLFSVLSLIGHNPGITSRQLCATLNILPPNLVGMINGAESRDLITKRPHPRDGRAMGLHLTPAGKKLMHQAEADASALEQAATARLSLAERKTLMRLLQKIYA